MPKQLILSCALLVVMMTQTIAARPALAMKKLRGGAIDGGAAATPAPVNAPGLLKPQSFDGVASKPSAPPGLSSSPSARLWFCASIIVVWLVMATLIFAASEGWSLAQAFFFAVDTGMSIGFGAFGEENTRTKAFTIVHVLLGASAVGGALALFAEAVVADASALAAAEFASAALQSAFARADSDGDGDLSRAELSGALADCGVVVGSDALDKTIERFDSNGDGRITCDEFMNALHPHLSHSVDGVDIAGAIRSMASLRNENALEAALRMTRSFVADNRTLLLWVGWIAMGILYGVFAEGWGLLTSIYFAVGGLSTGGLQAPALTGKGILPTGSSLFVGLYCLTGVPIFGFALGRFANLFVEKQLAAREKRALSRPISESEYLFAERLFSADGELDMAEFLALELLRLGKVDSSTLELLKAEFERRDKDGDGKLSRTEATTFGTRVAA